LEAILFRLKTLVIKENQKLRAIPYTTRLNQNQSSILARLYKRRSIKHRRFDQPFVIIAHNPCNPLGWRPQNYSSTGRDPITNCEKGNCLFEVTKMMSHNLEKLFHTLITINPSRWNQRGLLQPREYLSQNSETDW